MQRRDVIESVATGAGTFVWYALPDVVPSRATRGLVKAVLLTGLGTLGVAQVRREQADRPDRPTTASDDGALDRVRALTSTEPVLDGSVIGRADDGAGPRRAARAFVLVGAALTVVVGGSLAAERAIHRFGQRLGARGVSWPHTRIGVVSALAAGALAAGGALLADHVEADPA